MNSLPSGLSSIQAFQLILYAFLISHLCCMSSPSKSYSIKKTDYDVKKLEK
jgi:hypothetical protein